MTVPRSQLINLDITPFYHLTCRCVRGAFLLGNNPTTGANLDHRRQWVEDELHRLAGVFCMDLVAYAVMNNHYHAIYRVDRERAMALSTQEVADRWDCLYNVPEVVRGALDGDDLTEAERMKVDLLIDSWRERLMSLSWLMKVMNFNISVQANREDDKGGGFFWQGRFKSQALLDEASILRCMAYNDLNPVRARIADTPEDSDHTSIQKRLKEPEDHGLMPFKISDRDDLDGFQPCLPCTFEEYLELVDWTGRILREDKRGAIPTHYPAILDRIGRTPEEWVKHMTPQSKWRQKALGAKDKIKAYCQAIGQKWIWQEAVP